jgi:hypothetical protein
MSALCRRLPVQVQAAGLWRRLFSSEPPRRGWDKFYPKGKGRRPGAEAKGAKGELCKLSADFYW